MNFAETHNQKTMTPTNLMGSPLLVAETCFDHNQNDPSLNNNHNNNKYEVKKPMVKMIFIAKLCTHKKFIDNFSPF